MNIKAIIQRWLDKQPLFFLVENTIIVILLIAFVVIFSNKTSGFNPHELATLVVCPIMLGIIALSMAAKALLQGNPFGLLGIAIGLFLISTFMVGLPTYAFADIIIPEKLMFAIGSIPTGMVFGLHHWAWKKWGNL